MKFAVSINGLLLLAATSPTIAQDLTGEVTLGWRSVSVDGDANKYRQHINLDDGARLLRMHVDYSPSVSAKRSPDRATLDITGLGGDPFQNVSVRVQEFGSYDFRYDHRRSEYFYDDLLIAPEDASIEGSTGGDFHRFDTVRETDSADLDITLTARARLSLGFDRYERRGDSTTTLDIERDEFEFDRPVDEELQTITMGFQYRWDRLTIGVEEILREFDSETNIFLPGFSEGVNNAVDDLTTLDFYFLDHPWGYDSRETRLRLLGRPSDRLELRLGASLTDLDLDMLGDERAQGTDFLGQAFSIEETGSGGIDRDIALIDVDATYALSERVSLTAAVNRRELDQSGEFDFGSEGGASNWSIETTGAQLGMQFAWTAKLRLTAGWSVEARDVDALDATSTNLFPLGVSTDRDGFFLSASWRPSAALDVSALVESNSIDDPLSLASPTDTLRYRLRGRYRFENGVSLVATHKLNDLDNDNSGWSASTEQTDIRAAFAGERLQLSVGASIIDLSRSFEQLVTGGARQDLFDVNYRGDTTLLDARVVYATSENIDIGSLYRSYDNDGSFGVERDDVSVFMSFALPNNYRLGVTYRNVDYADAIEQYDADIVELDVGFNW